MRLFFLPVFTLWQRELIRFFRQRSRVIGAFVPPVFFWFLIGSGLGDSFRVPGLPADATGASISYLQYFFPGTVVLIILFTAIFSTISIIEDRHEGFLQSVLVAPVPRISIVLGKVLGGATIAFIQGLSFLILTPLTGISIGGASFLTVAGLLLLLAIGLTGLGFLLAWKLDSTQGFHAVMNLFLIPMWLLSGSLFPLSGAPRWLKLIMLMNPVTYGLNALQQTFHVHGQAIAPAIASMPVAYAVLTLFAGLMLIASVVLARRASR